ncbi:hypothetical protein [Streptomyces sp. NPDC091027]|uniref:hypothetical protein n=1 Tax=Streptomyces sp. NPDC091027 TaxID=3365971 RepID=UPI003829DC96
MGSTASRPVFRRSVVAVAFGAALTATSGCSVPVDAVTGISVSADGRLLGVMMVCGHRIDGATLSVADGDTGRQVTAGSWTADRPLVPGLATWPLEYPADGWTANSSPVPLTTGTAYTLHGWTKDNSWSASSVTFTLADRDLLTPGTVRYTSTSDTGEESTTTVPLARFEAEACRNA